VALVYCGAHEEGERAEARPATPQVWFQDPSAKWHYLAGSFTDYFRLAATHLGVPQWQFAFTDAGLPPAARQWLAFFCPERLAMAMESRVAAGAIGSARTSGGRHSALDAAPSSSSSAPIPARHRPRRRERSSSAVRRMSSSTGSAH